MKHKDEERAGDLSRRDFFRAVAAFGGVAIPAADQGARLVSRAGAGETTPAAGTHYALLIDTTRCHYCQRCVEACEEKHLDAVPGTFYTDVTLVHHRENGGQALAVPTHCMHCIDAPCVKVCEGKALEQTGLGAVTLDANRCTGCLSCANVCPFKKSLHYDPATKKMFKCDLCYDRISTGEKPACVEACAEQGFDALTFGSFEEIRQSAEKRAQEVDGVVFYPGATNTLVLLAQKETGSPALNGLFGLTPSYSQAARVKAGGTQFAHLGWLPVVGGLGLWMYNWRKDTRQGTEEASDEPGREAK
jgi:Fe-S-cluster-containing dehydrogenase component